MPTVDNKLVLTLKAVSHSIHHKSILHDIELFINHGTINTIVGANGAGKSTLLKCIAGDIPINSGAMRYAGKTYNPIIGGENLSRSIATLPQFSLLNFPFSCQEVVGLGRIPHATGTKIDQQIIEDCLNAVDMQDFAEQSYMQLSGGEKQRIQIGRILTQVWRKQDSELPRLLLLDEPCNSLDLAHQQQLMHLLGKLAQDGVTTLMVLHNINLASRFSDKLIALKNGNVLFQGQPNDVIHQDNIYELLGVDSTLIWDDEAKAPMVIPK